MKVLLTGATGFVGSHVVDFLSRYDNIQIYALIRNPTKLKILEGYKFQTLHGDLFSIPTLPRDLDCVIHIAGLTKALKPADYYTVNQQGTASLFQAIETQGIVPKQFILLSSMAASGPSEGGQAAHEKLPPQPVTHYGKSKLLGEMEALKYKNKFPVIIVRVGAVYGPGDTDFLYYFRWIKRGILPRFGRKKRLFTFCHAADLAKGLGHMAQKGLPSGEIFNIADPEPHYWDDLGTLAAGLLGVKTFHLTIPLPVVYTAAMFSEIIGRITGKPTIINREKFRDLKQEGWVADISKARTVLGFYPDFPLEEGLRDTLDWYIKNKLL